MPRTNWFPGTREGQLNMANLWVAVLSEINPNPNPIGGAQTNATAWGVPGELVMELEVQANKCAMLLAKVNDPTTATAVVEEECREAFGGLKGLMQELHAYFYLKAFPKAALARLGLEPHKTGHTPTPKPTRYVAFEIVVYVKDHRIVIEYRIAGSSSKSKYPYHGVELRLWILPLDAPGPANAEAPGWQSYASTATPWEKTFKDANDIGKRLYVVMRWENESTGDGGNEDDGKGPWSAIQSIVIP